MEIILKRRASNQQTISRIEQADNLRKRRFLVLDTMGLERVRTLYLTA